MKNKMLMLMLAGSFVSLYSCSGDSTTSDNKTTAETINERYDSTSTTENDKDIKFVVNAADGGMLEVKLGELAKERAVTQSVKNFGAMLMHDHSKANDELKALAIEKKISVPETLSEDKQKMYDDLAKKSGLDFDKDYMDMMVKDHKDDIGEFKSEASDGTDQQLKTWADGTIPTLQTHLDRATAIQDSLKKLK